MPGISACSAEPCEIESQNLLIDPSGEFKDVNDIANVLMTTSSTGSSGLATRRRRHRPCLSKPTTVSEFLHRRDANGAWQRSRSITLAVQMHAGQQIGQFVCGRECRRWWGEAGSGAPAEDLKSEYARTSDQQRQADESIHLLSEALYEAIILVVVAAFLGFWEWRSPLLMAISIPLTLAMTLGMMYLLGIDIQQVSIARLIIALGLLVDDLVVAGDAIKRELAMGHPPSIAAWLGPTKLARAIEFATITNVVSYLNGMKFKGNVSVCQGVIDVGLPSYLL